MLTATVTDILSEDFIHETLKIESAGNQRLYVLVRAFVSIDESIEISRCRAGEHLRRPANASRRLHQEGSESGILTREARDPDKRASHAFQTGEARGDERDDLASNRRVCPPGSVRLHE